MTELEQKALEILGRIAKREPQQLTPDLDLVGDLGIDSPKALELLCDIEEACDIEVPDAAVDKMDTVSDVLEMVRSCEAQA